MNSECRYRQFDKLWFRLTKPNDTGKPRPRWWKLPLVWIDPIRGYATGLFLRDALQPVEKAIGFQKLSPVIITSLVLLLIMWIQTGGRRGENETLSPSSFLAGLMIALMPLIVALSAIAIGAATAIAMSGFAAGYLMAAMATGCIGFAFMGRSPWLPVYTLVVASPMLINWFRRDKLVMPVRG